MKTNNRLRKIRIIVQSDKMNPVFGVVLPPFVEERWLGVHVRVRESGNCIILESGALPIPLKRSTLRSHSTKLNEVYV